jgi:hypothetical protein
MVCWDAGTPTTSTSDATVTLRTLVAALSGAAAYFTLGQLALAQQSPDLVSQTELRVCADPHNLPFSNQQGEGFENKIAELLAHDLNLKLSYTWYPDSQGFVRATLTTSPPIRSAIGKSPAAASA